MSASIRVLVVLAPAVLGAADWDIDRAVKHLDERQKLWSEWKTAQTTGGACVSCHSGLPYAMAQAAIREAKGEEQPTALEAGILNSLRARLESPDRPIMFPFLRREPRWTQGAAVEAVLAAFLLRPRFASPEVSRSAVDRMWSLQAEDGSWPWFHFRLDPWESETPLSMALLSRPWLPHVCRSRRASGRTWLPCEHT